MGEPVAASSPPPVSAGQRRSSAVVRAEDAKEYVFAVVGHIGSGTTTVAEKLGELLQGSGFDVVSLRASQAIREWADRQEPKRPLPPADKRTLAAVAAMQDLGDEMRQTDHAAVAVELVRLLRQARARKTGAAAPVDGQIVAPDRTRRAYILDSLRHDAEVQLLRRLYGNAFVLIGVVCEERERALRLNQKYADAGAKNAQAAMARDADDPSKKHGQKVAKAFWLADFFVDNTAPRYADGVVGKASPSWKIGEQAARLIKIITHDGIERPLLAETAMYVAYGAARRSACLSRGVGAALLDQGGNVVAIGVNDVPKAGGGLYGSQLSSDSLPKQDDHRCAYYSGPSSDSPFCRNTREQRVIIENIIERVSVLSSAAKDDHVRERLIAELQSSRIGELTEFSRAVHAEMEALLAAARSGVSTVGTRLFVTTFPCHYCARHLVSAGVDEVQYIEPYPKSHALSLHEDAITQILAGWVAPSRKLPDPPAKVLFRPFVGVSPRLYERVFVKDREWKNKTTGILLQRLDEPDWGSSLYLGRLSYLQLEAELTKTEGAVGGGG